VAAEPALVKHTLVLLMRRADAPEISDAEADQLQGRHLAFLDAQRDAGVLAAAGPFRDQPDERWRGMCIYRVGREQALEAAQQDPAVRAGRLEVQALTWCSRAGEISY
jgi:uncharacterized protein YciI